MSMKFKNYSLDTICELQMGKTPKRSNAAYWGKGLPWVSIADMKEKLIVNTKEQITTKAIDECGCKMIPKGTLLLSFKLSIGKIGFAGTDLYTNEAIVALLIRDHKQIYSEYLYYVLRTIPLKGKNKAAKGVTLNTKSLKRISIPIPELLEDQIRVAEILSKVETLIAYRHSSIVKLNEFLKSSFLTMFGNYPEFKKNAIIKTIGEVCEVKGGGTPSKSNLKYFKGDIPWVSPKDMKSLYVTTSIDKITKQAIAESATNLIPEGSVLMVVRSSILKNKLPVAINLVDVAINQDMKAFTSKDLLSSYLLHFFVSNEVYILKKVRNLMADNFDFDDIKALEINVPDPKSQMKFKNISEKTELIKELCSRDLSELTELFNTLSQRIFSGELDLNKLNVIAKLQVQIQFAESIKTDLINTRQYNTSEDRRPKTSKIGNLTVMNYYEEEFTLLIKENFKNFHFRFRDIEQMFSDEEGGVITYYTTEELKQIKVKGAIDIRGFIFDCIEKKNKSLKLNQIYYDSLSDLNLKKINLKDGNETVLAKINNKEISIEELSGIYFQIA